MNNQYPPGWSIEYASYKLDRANAISLRLALAAPKLLKCLKEATENQCLYCNMHTKDKCKEVDGECYVQEWREAIINATGENQ